MVPPLWHGLLTMPLLLTEGLPSSPEEETFGPARWHGQETMPQRHDHATTACCWLIISERALLVRGEERPPSSLEIPPHTFQQPHLGEFLHHRLRRRLLERSLDLVHQGPGKRRPRSAQLFAKRHRRQRRV